MASHSRSLDYPQRSPTPRGLFCAIFKIMTLLSAEWNQLIVEMEGWKSFGVASGVRCGSREKILSNSTKFV